MLSYLSIESLKGISSSSGISQIEDLWKSQINGKKLSDQIYHHIALPPLVFGEEDFEIIQSHTIRPNFVTNSLVRGELINLDTIDVEDYNIVSGKIVLLEKADPGYDWIFSKGIKGLVTRFGGAASHMAIRSAEFGIPAAIGCGEIIFNNIKDKQIIELDCMNKKIIIIR
jgi:phosphohistidine swiveling domain-containing protein